MPQANPIVEIFYFAGCPNHQPTVALAREVIRDLRLDAELRDVAVETAQEAEEYRFVGSPSVRVNGKDIEREVWERNDFGLGCRLYGAGGVPPKELLIEALREASSSSS